MSLKRKAMVMISGLLILLTGSSAVFSWFAAEQVDKKTNTVVNTLQTNSLATAQKQLAELTTNMGRQIISLEQEMEQGMMNAALVVQQMDGVQALSDADLLHWKGQTEMDDFYLTDSAGVFTHSTEPAAIGLNLFEFDGMYRDLVTGAKSSVVSEIRIKQETGEIYKFLAIPRINGKGVVESAVNAKVFEQGLSELVNEQNGVQAVYLLDKSGVVLTETLRPGQTALWQKGQPSKVSALTAIIESGQAQMQINPSGNTEIYTPIFYQNQLRYVLYAQVDSKPYLATAEQANRALAESQSIFANGMVTSVSVNGMISVLFIAVFLKLINSKINPLLRMKQAAERMARGDLVGADISIDSKDEIGSLALSFNQMAGNLRSLIGQVGISSEMLAAAAEQLNANASQSGLAAEHIASRVEVVSAGAQMQVQNVEESVEIIGRMNEGVQRIAANASHVSSTAQSALAQTEEGNGEIQKAVEQMDSINGTMHRLADVIQGLGERTAEIERFVTFIKSVADQTNLLALNATIEAARAGQYGRGFAVVAAEVRKLAEQSMMSAHQVSELSLLIQSDTQEAVQSMQAVSEEVNAGISVVHGAGLTFRHIQQSIQSVAEQIEEVSLSTDCLQGDSLLVTNSVRGISAQVEDTAAGTQQIFGSTEEQMASMQEIVAAAASLSELAESLHEQVAQFQV